VFHQAKKRRVTIRSFISKCNKGFIIINNKKLLLSTVKGLMLAVEQTYNIC